MNELVHPFDATLRDGRAVHLRAMHPGDEAELVQAFERSRKCGFATFLDPRGGRSAAAGLGALMSASARYMRFMRVVREPNLVQLRQVLTSFPAQGIGLVATVPAADGIDIVGSAIAMITGDGSHCEFAITVAERFGGAGLATLLLKSLIDAATRRGLVEMEGFVLAINQPMLRLASRLGFSIEPDPDDASVRLCRLRLARA